MKQEIIDLVLSDLDRICREHHDTYEEKIKVLKQVPLEAYQWEKESHAEGTDTMTMGGESHAEGATTTVKDAMGTYMRTIDIDHKTGQIGLHGMPHYDYIIYDPERSMSLRQYKPWMDNDRCGYEDED